MQLTLYIGPSRLEYSHIELGTSPAINTMFTDTQGSSATLIDKNGNRLVDNTNTELSTGTHSWSSDVAAVPESITTVTLYGTDEQVMWEGAFSDVATALQGTNEYYLDFGFLLKPKAAPAPVQEGGKNIQLRNFAGDNLFPRTLGKLVTNEAGDKLDTVAAGAQVNAFETIKLNGIKLENVDKTVNVVLPDEAVYGMSKEVDGDIVNYYLTKDEVKVGSPITILPDMHVENAELKTCVEANKPVSGYVVGDKYIDLTIANSTDHVYVKVTDLVDVYTGGNGISVENNVISIDDSIVVNHTEFEQALAGKQNNLDANQMVSANSGITSAKVANYEAYEAKIAAKQEQLSEAQLKAVDSGITSTAREGIDLHLANADLHVTTADKAAWSGKQGKLTEAQMFAVNSGITDTKVATFDGYEDTLNNKADKATTLIGYNILNGMKFQEL